MAAHFWIFPWIAFFCGLAAFVAAHPRAPRPGRAFLTLPTLIVWGLVTAGATALSLRIGAAAGVDYLAARGVLLGSVGALLLTWSVGRVVRGRSEAAPAALVVGWGVAVTAAARLWMTHGELSGLTGLILGAVIPLVIFGAALFDEETETGALTIAGLAFLATLSAAVQLGFTRARLIEQAYWPDVPLLLGAALCLGLLIAVAIPKARLRALWIGLPYLLATYGVGEALAHERTPLKLLGVGVLTFGLLLVIARRSRGAEEGPIRALAPSLALLVLAVTVSYAYWAGYGVALMLLAGWTVVAATPWRERIWESGGSESSTEAISGVAVNMPDTDRTSVAALLPAFAFGALAAMHRLVLLQNSDALDLNAVTDAWDFFALSIGVMLPFAAAAAAGAPRGRVPAWLACVFWLLALTLPALVADYVLGARAGGGLLLGAALAALFSHFAGRLRARVLIGTLTVGALTLIMTPIASQWDEPTRRVRTLILIGAVVLLAILQLLPSRRGVDAVVEG